MQPSPEVVKNRMDYWALRAKEYRTRSLKDGFLKRSEWWELEYFEAPYLAFASDDYLKQRFISHFHNMVRLNRLGQICPVMMDDDTEQILTPLFSHMNLEFAARGGTPGVALNEANTEIRKYFSTGRARGVKLFEGMPDSIPNVIVKFSKKEYVCEALDRGQLRLMPAAFYDNSVLKKAMQDRETERDFHILAFEDSMQGRSTTLIRGRDTKIEDGFLKIVKTCPDYLLWSACTDIDRRLPDDFDADAALIIKEPEVFAYRLREAINLIWPKCPVWCGSVKYYDPCSAASRLDRPEQIKHFSYRYQREWRLCAFPAQFPNEPIYVTLGDLTDIAEVVSV